MLRPLAFTLLTSLAISTHAKSPFGGTWVGTMNDQPAIELVINEPGGKIAGTMGFYFQRRGTDGKWKVESKHPVPLLVPKVQGKTLEFEVTHHKTHGGTELGPNVKFRVQLTGADEARLFKLDEPTRGEGLKLTRKN
jgi:hypothetical protein